MTARGRIGSKLLRPQKRRIFFGCEGASEGSYAALLQSLLNGRGLPIALDIAILNPGAGDPCELVREAAARADASAQKRGEHAGRYVLLDGDRHDAATDLGRRTLDLARQGGIALIWQRPCHEALLLRHLPGCRDHRPSTTVDAKAALVRRWPEYEKGMSSQRLASTIDEAAISRAAQVEPDLRGFLIAVGFLPDGKPGARRTT